MNSNLTSLMYQDNPVRVVIQGDAPWFVAKDIAITLGYSNPQKAIRDHCKHHRQIGMNETFTPLDSQTVIIPESDVYRLVIRSKMPVAERFEAWIVEEVLPSIRKNGGYMNGQENMSEDEVANLAMEYVTRFKVERQRNRLLEQQNQALESTVTALTPRAEYAETVLAAVNGINASTIAKGFGFRSAKQLNEILHQEHIQYKLGSQWLLYAKYAAQGYTVEATSLTVSGGEVTTNRHTLWTEKGKEFLYRLLTKRGLIKTDA